jgi:hypothetical protein
LAHEFLDGYFESLRYRQHQGPDWFVNPTLQFGDAEGVNAHALRQLRLAHACLLAQFPQPIREA